MIDSYALQVFNDGNIKKVLTNTLLDSETKFIWYHLFSPTTEDMFELSNTYDIHPLAIEDCLDDDQIPKMESYSQHLHLVFNAFYYIDKEIQSEGINLFIGEKYLITVTHSAELNNAIKNLYDKLTNKNNDLWHIGPSWLMHLIIDRIIDGKMIALETIEDETDSIEDLLLTSKSGIDFAQIQNLRYAFQLLRKNLFHERNILNNIIRENNDFINQKSIYLYRDIYDHIIQLYELTEACRETVKNIVELHLAMANNQMAEAADNTNKTIRRLTFITTVFMPLTLITGIGGMSEFTELTGSHNWPIAYGLLIFMFIVLGLLSYKWLESLDNKL